LRATFQGFRPASVRIRVAARPLSGQKLVLALADLQESVSVDNGAGQLDTSAANNLSAVTIDRQMFESLPVIDWDNPNLRFVDITGDGHADVLLSESQVFTWYPSLAERGFGPATDTAIPLDERDGPRIVFADEEQPCHAEVARASDISTQGTLRRHQARRAKAHLRRCVQRPARFVRQDGVSAIGHPDGRPAGHRIRRRDGCTIRRWPQPVTEALLAGTITHQYNERTLISVTPNYEQSH
jgi:hypothetical protein